MQDQDPKLRQIFDRALELDALSDRREYLNKACGTDSDLRNQVEALLAAHEDSGSFLEAPPLTVGIVPIHEGPGTVIGPYKLLQELGEGGMGVVYLAEQREPIDRQVALKIIKPGMDSQQVLSRFEAERQALAMMDHPNIARVLDAGTTDQGRPYFVMELVKGIPINAYCDEHNLSTKERLALFGDVCRALQHAHQKGIVHRDVKPTNVLVAEFDNEAVPKVIDFGVAKAVSQRLTERTMFTQFGQIVGTPEYMSPEQAKLNQLDVDTRSDIYSLGVLLYELLTGATPFDKDRLRSAAFDELLRIIREEDPPRPSVRLSTVDELPSVATKRQSEPRKLSLLLRGELDWIVMKAMEKERAHRYDSASAFADDIERYLNGDPVVACPPSRSYLLRKTVQRHKVAIATTALVMFTLLIGVVGTSWMMIRLAEREKDLYELAIEGAVTAAMAGEFARTESLIERIGEESPELRATLTALAALYSGDAAKALAILEGFESEHTTALRSLLALTYTHVGNPDAHFEQLETLLREPPKDRQDILGLLDHMLYSQALFFYDSTVAVSYARRVVEARPSWHLAHVVLGEALAYAAGDTFDDRMKPARESLKCIDDGCAGLPGSPYALAVRLHALHTAIRYGESSGVDESEMNIWREQAAETANALEPHGSFVFGRAYRAMYFDFIQDKERAENDWVDAYHRSNESELYASWVAGWFLKEGRGEEAKVILGEDSSWSLYVTPSGQARKRRLEHFTRLEYEGALGVQQEIWWRHGLIRMGMLPESEEKWRELANKPYPRVFMLDYPLRLFSGQITPDLLKKEAEDTGSRRWMAAAQIYIACHYFRQERDKKRREAAKVELEECLDHDLFMDNSGFFARYMLDQLIKDDKYPRANAYPSTEPSDR